MSIEIAKRHVLHGLTGIRFFAALAVLIFHYGASYVDHAGAPRAVATLLHNGYLGVSLFFMLSGFIITYTYDGRLTAAGDLREFAIARFSRLYPVYLLALLMALPFAWPTLKPFDVIGVLAMIQSWTLPASGFGYSWVMQAWTLSVELTFYLATPFLLRSLRHLPVRSLVWVGALAAALLVGLWSPTFYPVPDQMVGRFAAFLPIPFARMIEFFYGAVLCKLFLGAGKACARLATGPLVWCNLILIMSLLASSGNGWIVSIAMVLAGLLILQIAATESSVSRFLSTQPMLLLGGSSYALYLIQWPVRHYMDLMPVARLGAVLNPIVAVAASILVYKFWEEPARRWLRDRLSTRRRGETSIVPAYSKV